MRKSQLSRKTKETDIFIQLDLDGGGRAEISTGIGFLDHMLTALAVHSGMDLTVRAKGDLEVDCHHTVEDVGILLGQVLGQALGDKSGIARYGSAWIPMDEALASSVLDVSGRPFLVFSAPFRNERVGAFDTCLTEEFFRALCMNAAIRDLSIRNKEKIIFFHSVTSSGSLRIRRTTLSVKVSQLVWLKWT